MSNPSFTNTSINMVQLVRNTIEKYSSEIRALAQEPVQNSIDAARSKKSTVNVEYRLLRRKTFEGDNCFLLTVTDSGTTGLGGPILSQSDLHVRGYKLKRNENWAAFEGQGYTKEDEDALGSRGQGKTAFLYHSFVPGAQRRMMMLYDTNLPDGDYRLGVRYARPMDQILSEPLRGDKARMAVQQDFYDFEDLAVPLALDSLGEIGTRVIVPFLGAEAKEAFSDGQLKRWLQRCWWRAIQIGKVKITVVDDENDEVHTIEVPPWWQDIPRRLVSTQGTDETRPGCVQMIRTGERIGKNDIYMKHMVMLHDENLEADEIIGDPSEFAGIQLLRGRQWIETRGTREEYGDDIPPDKRAGFRGFIEFDERLVDPLLREIESPSHDSFHGLKKGLMREIRPWLREQVRDFSTQMGWIDEIGDDEEQVSQREQQVGEQIARTFLNRGRLIGNDDGLKWNCRLRMQYPQPETSRVDYGERLSNLVVTLRSEPEAPPLTTFDLKLSIVNDVGERHYLFGKENELMRPDYRCKLGDWKVLEGRADPKRRQLPCPQPGVYSLCAEIISDGSSLAKDQRLIYVACDPPMPSPTKPQTLFVTVANQGRLGQMRIRARDGDRLLVHIGVVNRATEAFEGLVKASISGEDRTHEHELVSEAPVYLGGSPAGDIPRLETAWNQEITLVLKGNNQANATQGSSIYTFSPGKLRIDADLYSGGDRLMQDSRAHAQEVIWFEADPDGTRSELPFLRKASEDRHAMWWLDEREEPPTLFHREKHPLKSALKQSEADVYTEEIIFHGLLEWALRPMEDGDETRMRQMRSVQLNGADSDLHDGYARRLEELGNHVKSTTESTSSLEFHLKLRETVALMRTILREGHS